MPRGVKNIEIEYRDSNYDSRVDRSMLIAGNLPPEEMARIADKMLRLGAIEASELIKMGFKVTKNGADK